MLTLWFPGIPFDIYHLHATRSQYWLWAALGGYRGYGQGNTGNAVRVHWARLCYYWHGYCKSIPGILPATPGVITVA